VEVGNALRQLPSVDRLLQEATVQALVARYARPTVLAAVRAALDAERATGMPVTLWRSCGQMFP
jgi:hypothetical protein